MSSLDDILGKKPVEENSQQASTQPAVTQPQPTAVQSALAPQQNAEQKTAVQPTEKPADQGNKEGVATTTPPPLFTPPPLQQQKDDPATQLMDHPSADADAQSAPKVPERLSMEEMYKRLNPYTPPTAEQLEKERKREKRERLFAAIGDGISALSNLYFTTKGAPNMYNPEYSQSKQVASRWQKLKEDRDAKLNAYIRDMMNAKQADDANAEQERRWMRQLGIDAYNHKKDADAIQYKKDRDKAKDDQWKQSFDQKEKQFTEAQGLRKDGLDEKKRSNKANEKLKASRNSEAARHNRAMEGQGAERIAIARENSSSGGKGKGSQPNTIRLNDGSVHTYEPKMQGALTSLAPAMIKKARAAAERYKAVKDKASQAHYSALADALDRTTSKDALAAVVASNIGDFPSMDKEIRSILGVSEGKKPNPMGGETANNGKKKNPME